MKVRNFAFFGVMASILGISAANAASDTVIASQAYVDAVANTKQPTLQNTHITDNQTGQFITDITATNGQITVTRSDAVTDLTGYEQTVNKETGNSLTDSTTKYPSSHTVTEVLKGKVAVDQTAENKNKVLVTDNEGKVTTYTPGEHIKLEGDKIEATGFQAPIDGLNDIIAGAQAGATAATTIATYGDIVTHDADDFATSEQGTKADNSIQGVKVNGTALTATNGVVNVTVPTDYLTASDIEGKVNINQEENKNMVMTTGNDGQVKATAVGNFLEVKNGVLTTTYTQGDNVTIDERGKISATDTTYTAGNGLALDGTTFKLSDGTTTSLGKADSSIQGVKVNGTALTATNGVVDVTVPTITDGSTSGAAGLAVTNVTQSGGTVNAERSVLKYDTAMESKLANYTTGKTAEQFTASECSAENPCVLTVVMDSNGKPTYEWTQMAL